MQRKHTKHMRGVDMAIKARDAVPNAALYNLRDAQGWSQQEVADGLNTLATSHPHHWSCTAQTVSRWERGVVERPEPIARRLLSELFEVPISEPGFTRPRHQLHRDPVPKDVALVIRTAPSPTDPLVQRSQDEWRETRRSLNAHRRALTDAAARLYDPEARLGDTGLLVGPGWVLDQPRDLTTVGLRFDSSPDAPALTGGEDEAATCLPFESEHERYGRYSHAIRDIVPPRLFDNRLSYRLVGLDWSAPEVQMTFGFTSYFEMIDVCELLAHETALSHTVPGQDTITQPSWRRLAWRKLLANPFDLTRRALLPSIDTLTIRRNRSGSPSMILHQRDAERVAVAGQLLHIMPAGVFQPSSVLPAAAEADLSLWRNVMREYSEELLGNPEHGGDGQPIDYDTVEPFRSLDEARRAGTLRTFCFGIALDALTLVGEILTATVIDADVYDDVFAGLVSDNTEGRVAATTIPFEEHTIRRLLSDQQYHLAPAAAGCIDLTWKHRDQLLAD